MRRNPPSMRQNQSQDQLLNSGQSQLVHLMQKLHRYESQKSTTLTDGQLQDVAELRERIASKYLCVHTNKNLSKELQS